MICKPEMSILNYGKVLNYVAVFLNNSSIFDFCSLFVEIVYAENYR